MFLVRYCINNPLVTNLFLALILITGIATWYSMPQEMFPIIELDKVRITTIYEGASPEEVERLVTLPIEEEFDGVADIDVISSSSNEGLSNILIELKSGTDIDDFIRDVRTVLDGISDLPELAERPEVKRLKTRFPVISVALYGDIGRAQLFEQAERVKRRLLEIPGVASAGMAGNREWELWVVVDPQRLASRRVPLSLVVQSLRDNLRDLPGGSIKAGEGDILLRGKGTVPDPHTIGQVVLRTNALGGKLLLNEVAEIELRLEEAKTIGRFNGKRSVNLIITKTTESSTIEVSQSVRDVVKKMQQELPPALRIGVFSDLSKYVKTRLETVKSSGLVGLALVLLSLYLFLNFRVALITALGIPVSFLFATILLNYFGHTINMVSLFAFLIVLGMIVDDAIIVTENIYRHMEAGVPAKEASLLGAQEVYWPVVASTATTIAAFLPMFAVGGTMGAFIAVIPVVVIFALLGSLIEAFGVLPSHANQLLKVNTQRRTSRIDWAAVLQRYVRLIRWVLINRYFVTIAITGVLVITIAFAFTRISFQLFGHVDAGQFFINAEAPNTYSVEDTVELARDMENVILETLDDNEMDSLLTNVGVSFIDFTTVKFDNNYMQFIIDLKKQKPQGVIERFVAPITSLRFSWEGTRDRDTTTIINELRMRLQQVPGIQKLSILRPQGGPAGADIEVGVVGPDVKVLREIGDQIILYLRKVPGVSDIQQDLEPGKLEYQYTMNDRGRQLGLTQLMLAEAVRSGFQGLEITHVTSNNKRIPVRVIYPEHVRTQSAELRNLKITLPNGKTVFLNEVADIEVGRSFNIVKRRDMQRLSTVTAEVNSSITTSLVVAEQIKKEFADLENKWPNYELLFLGEKRKATESINDMMRALLFSLIIIFFILATLFKSLLDPLVVMFAIPFGAIGVIIGHYLLGHHLQFLSMIGFLALAGIVVNDSLILVDFAKRLRAKGWDRMEAMVEAGRVRARPIILTSVTTFLGISPLIFFSTGQTAFLAPMAVSLGFGLLFATFLILIGIPSFYLIADDIRIGSKKLLYRFMGKSRPQES